MIRTPFDPPNYDKIHQLSLSVTASSDHYDRCSGEYALGQCTADELGDALEQYQDDGVNLYSACRDIPEKAFLVATNQGQIFSLTIDHHFVMVKVEKALNISGGLDQMAVKELLNV